VRGHAPLGPRGELDCLHIPQNHSTCSPSNRRVRAARIGARETFDLVRSAYPYRDLTRPEFDEVVRMLAEGFSTKRGRRAALIHHDA